MKTNIFNTDNSWVGFIARLSFGLFLLPHGAQKLLGWFGGFGYTGTMQFFTETVHLPWIIGFLVIIIEFFGSLCLLIGLGTRIWSVIGIINFFGIMLSSHIQNGFFMNWIGDQKGEGVEYFLLFIVIALITLLTGGGKYAVDRLIAKAG